ncbi:MAG: PhoPQ-activated pathogenicity-related family protein [Acidobacteria bacterium]|nr:PhoPQ-activated pathogenicity-related family protein [Acidobacteriota bacterium]
MIRTARVLLLALLVSLVCAAAQTALDRYVAAPDPQYRYELAATIPGDGYTAYVLDMTSQQWLGDHDTDRPVWKHWLTIVRPDRLEHTTGLLVITGGSNGAKPPAKPDAMLPAIATATNSVVAEIRQIPNEPLVFTADGKRRNEDEIIAYTWDKFLRTGDEKWPLRLPMTKAAVRAMDTVTAFLAGEAGGKVKVGRFVVTGGSKRGWTAWTTAAVDRRVTAVIPAVIDLLNLEPSFIHHWRAYGFWAPAVKDYVEMKVMDWNGTPEFRKLMELIEPYHYRDRLTMPKFLLNSAGDQFFLPDSSQFYFDGLRGEKYLRYVPNSDHSLRNTDARESLTAYYDAILRNTPRPRFGWKFESDGSIRVTAAGRPAEVKLWQAANPSARDFRLESLGPAYKSSPVEGAAGVYVGRVESPASGWTAFFLELTYPTGGKYPLKFTTAVRVLPDKYPFPAPQLAPPK